MKRFTPLVANILLLSIVSATPSFAANNLQRTIQDAQQKIVKVYGAGGLRGMEAYQTGTLISPDGHILTALSYVLDTDDVAIILNDGRKFQPELLGSDPLRELAVLKISVEGEQLPAFDLNQSVVAVEGQRVLALSNLYGIATGDEPVSVLQGVVTAIAPLNARRGSQRANYLERVYVLDAYANNPGAAGGALVDWQGQLIGILGKELRSRVTGTWLNYALPAEDIAPVVEDLLAGREVSLLLENSLAPERGLSSNALGFMLVPDVLTRTPPYVDSVEADSPADIAGLRADDLVVFVDEEPIVSCRAVHQALGQREYNEEIQLSILRDGSLLEFRMQAPSTSRKMTDGEQLP